MFRNKAKRQERITNIKLNIRDLKLAKVDLEESIRICATEYDGKDTYHEYVVTLPIRSAVLCIEDALLRLEAELEALTS